MEAEETSNQIAETTAQAEQASSDIIAKHRKPRSDKGKPRGARNGGTGRVEVVNAGGPEANQVNSTPIDVEAVRKGVSAFLKTIDALLVRKTYSTAKQITKDENFARSIASEVKSPVEENELISDLTASVAQRHEILAKFAPEVLLVAAVGAYGTRVAMAFKQLSDIAETQAQIANDKK